MSIEKWFGLKDTCAVLFGANGLIGSECAASLEACGAHVVAVDQNFDRVKSGEQKKLDITNEDEVSVFFKELEGLKEKYTRWSFINVSYPRTQNWGSLGFENFSLSDWNENVNLHLGSTFQLSQKSVEFLKQTGGGSITLFGSIYGLLGPNMSLYAGTKMNNPAAYAAIKAGTAGLARYIATTFGEHQIRANVVCPGGVENGQPESFVKSYCEKTPLGRMATPADVAGLVSFLASPSAEYMSGQIFPVDGGWSAW